MQCTAHARRHARNTSCIAFSACALVVTVEASPDELARDQQCKGVAGGLDCREQGWWAGGVDASPRCRQNPVVASGYVCWHRALVCFGRASGAAGRERQMSCAGADVAGGVVDRLGACRWARYIRAGTEHHSARTEIFCSSG